MCVNNLSKVALDSAVAGIEPATSSRKSNALIIVPPPVNRNVSSRVQKVTRDSADVTSGGALTTCGSATENARLPTVNRQSSTCVNIKVNFNSTNP